VSGQPAADPIRVGLLTSVGRTLDAFFPPIAERLAETGFAVASASGTHSALPGWTQLAGFTQRPSPLSAVGVRAVRRWSRAEDLDVVVTSTATASAIVRTALLPVPIVYFCHGLHWEGGSAPADRPWQLIETVLLRRTASVITLNSFDEEWFRAHTRRPVFRLPYGVGVPLDRFPAAPVPAGELQLLWVGDFTPRKRPDQALAVVRELLDLGCPVRLRMLGEGPLRQEVLQEVAATRLAHIVTAEGRGDVAQALRSASALLHTAAWEGLPRVALEAAAVGRWCYGFDVKGFRDAPLVRVAADGDVAALARRIADDQRQGALADVPDVRQQLDVTEAADRIGAAVRETLGRR
jgi:glycosyltransferase involved in cell wall biosynthesis